MKEKVLPQHESPQAAGDFLGRSAPSAEGEMIQAAVEKKDEKREAWAEFLDRIIDELRSEAEISTLLDLGEELDGTEYAKGYIEGFKAGREYVIRELEKRLEWMEG